MFYFSDFYRCSYIRQRIIYGWGCLLCKNHYAFLSDLKKNLKKTQTDILVYQVISLNIVVFPSLSLLDILIFQKCSHGTLSSFSSSFLPTRQEMISLDKSTFPSAICRWVIYVFVCISTHCFNTVLKTQLFLIIQLLLCLINPHEAVFVCEKVPDPACCCETATSLF